ncbi:sodium/glutamate symporter [Pelistega suis]|uniref:Sodium/glutamate symporter n=1 Tax=Pelistega suis TaxID=1631957 RepID=A0A849P4H4_9BURK|nr:sodium/glutamate symporter [Pelistega suis]NOL52569.1 sodium/glutamate symporter [Pelistega suis]
MSFQFDALSTLLLALLCLLLGIYLKSKIPFFEKFCIPAPVIGGFSASIIIWLLYLSNVEIKFDTALQGPLMIAFFTTVGIGGSYKLLKTGGKALIVYLLVCWFVALYQNALGAWLASLLDIHPVLGVMAGAVSLEGGHGAAAAFGKVAEGLGVDNATSVAISAATFGLIAGSLLGGPIANYLIQKHKVTIQAEEIKVDNAPLSKTGVINTTNFIRSLALIVIIMVIGLYLSGVFTDKTGFALPSYVGAMFVAIVFRNINDSIKVVEIKQETIDLIADVSLGIFLTMAMMNMKIWQITSVALPLLIILLLQVLALIALTVFVVFRLLGKNYDAAVMCGGLIGHGLGATPNAIANMSSVTEKYKVFSPKAFLIIPLCGAVLIDIVALPWHTWMINFFTK